MKTLSTYFLTLSIALVFTIFTSCEDDFTEEDLLDTQRTVNYSVQVVDLSSIARSPISGASVSIVQNGATVMVTTDENGIAVFPDTSTGITSLTVSASGFTSGSATVDLTLDNDLLIGQAFSRFPVFSLTENTARVTGVLEYSDADTFEDILIPDGVATINFSIYTQEDAFDDSDAYLIDNGNYGGLSNLVYEGFTTTTTSNGIYNIDLPASYFNFYEMPYVMEIQEFVIDNREYASYADDIYLRPGEIYQFNRDFGTGLEING